MMIKSFRFSVFFLIAFYPIFAQSELITWESKSGHTVKSKVIEVIGDRVKMELENGSIRSFNISLFTQKDQQKLVTYRVKPEQLKESVFSLGKVHGPVNADSNSSYYVYVPKNLAKGTLAPLFFYTDAGGAKNTKKFSKLIPMAELFGCVVAISKEAANAVSVEACLSHSDDCVTDLMKKLPIDKRRLHFGGNSGGGNIACLNSIKNKAWGLMPDVAVLIKGQGVNTSVVYALGGAWDFNRFFSAEAAHLYRENGFHRMSEKGHAASPASHLEDGFFWMTCKFYAKHKSEYTEESANFELEMIKWLRSIRRKESARAYSNAVILRDTYGINKSNKESLDRLISELSNNSNNTLYHDGLNEINAFTKKHWVPIAQKGWRKKGYSEVAGRTDLKKLMEKYNQVKELKDVIAGMNKPAPRVK